MKAISARSVLRLGNRAALLFLQSVLSLHYLMIPLAHFPCPRHPPPSSSPPTSSSSLLHLLLLSQRRGAPVVCVTVDPCKEDRSNISPPVYEAFRWGLTDMMIGADGRTGAPGFEVSNRQRWL